MESLDTANRCSSLRSAIPENRSFFGRFFSLTTACFFVRSLVSFLSDAGDVGDAGVWLRLRRAKAMSAPKTILSIARQ
jgi:hypothetical protein